MFNDSIRAYKTYEDGKQLVIGLYNDKCFLGNIALLAESTYTNMEREMEEKLVDAPDKGVRKNVVRDAIRKVRRGDAVYAVSRTEVL